mgnify:CR=1 FL=1
MTNVCIIVLDAVRAQNLSCYGHNRKTTPNIDKIAEESVVFKNAVSPAAVTLDSTASLFTGLYPGEHRTGQNGEIITEVPQLPEILRENGYETGAVTTNPFITPGFGFERGIDEFYSGEHRFESGMNIRKFFDRHKHRSAYQIYLRFLIDSIDRNFISHVGNALQFRFDIFNRNDNGAQEATNSVLNFIDSKESPWFLYTHYSEAHMKNTDNLYKLPDKYKYKFVDEDTVESVGVERDPDEEYSKASQDVHEKLYDGAIHYLDDKVKEIINSIKSNNEWDDTLFIITSDHGECLGDFGAMGHGHLHEPGIHVPLIVKLPSQVKKSGDSFNRTNTLGIYKTILEITNTGSDVTHTQVPGIFEDQDYVLTQDYSGSWDWSSYSGDIKGQHALYSGDIKLIKQGNKNRLYKIYGRDNRKSLIDDPREEELEKLLNDYTSTFNESEKSVDDIGVDKKTSERLEDLGYL